MRFRKTGKMYLWVVSRKQSILINWSYKNNHKKDMSSVSEKNLMSIE